MTIFVRRRYVFGPESIVYRELTCSPGIATACSDSSCRSVSGAAWLATACLIQLDVDLAIRLRMLGAQDE